MSVSLHTSPLSRTFFVFLPRFSSLNPCHNSYLDKIIERSPNTISMSFPPIVNLGTFKRLVQPTKGANTGKFSGVGMTTPRVCGFIGDPTFRKIPHYLPRALLNYEDCPEVFDT